MRDVSKRVDGSLSTAMMDLKVAIENAWVALPLLAAYLGGYWYGHVRGRAKERAEWTAEVLPALKRLEWERNSLWRSAVTKTQKLNRIARTLRGK